MSNLCTKLVLFLCILLERERQCWNGWRTRGCIEWKKGLWKRPPRILIGGFQLERWGSLQAVCWNTQPVVAQCFKCTCAVFNIGKHNFWLCHPWFLIFYVFSRFVLCLAGEIPGLYLRSASVSSFCRCRRQRPFRSGYLASDQVNLLLQFKLVKRIVEHFLYFTFSKVVQS